MMIKSENKVHDDDHKSVKGSGSAKAIPEARQNIAYFCYHAIPLALKVDSDFPLPRRNQKSFFQRKGIGGCSDK